MNDANVELFHNQNRKILFHFNYCLQDLIGFYVLA